MSTESSCLCCSLKQCSGQNRQISPRDGRVEVCTVLPQNKLSRSVTDRFLVAWTKSGDAVFHEDCWNNLRTCANRRNDKKSTLKLSATEKLMVKEAAKTAERHDGADVFESEGQRIAQLILSSQHCVVFTGAGISTSAGIGDYRGKSGKWTQEERSQVAFVCDDKEDEEPTSKKPRTAEKTEDSCPDGGCESDDDSGDDGVPYEELRPTYTHEALKVLLDLGHIKYIISQNCDGLHLLSGIQSSNISELHGNIFLETCEKCGQTYERNFYVSDDVGSQYYEEMSEMGQSNVKKPSHAVQCSLCGLTHRTGRKCSQKGCRGYLKDTIINFRDHLDETILTRAEDHAKESDLMLCLGSTLRVTPACDLVDMGREPLRLVICNRQKTPFDQVAMKKGDDKHPLGARLFGDCDRLMREVMKYILSQDALESWESQRDERMKCYQEKRS